MNETQKPRYLAINQMNQPVELHLPSGLVVVPPRGRSPLCANDLGSPQLQVLRSSRRIMIQTVEPIAEKEQAGELPPAAVVQGERGDPMAPNALNRRRAPSGGENAL